MGGMFFRLNGLTPKMEKGALGTNLTWYRSERGIYYRINFMSAESTLAIALRPQSHPWTVYVTTAQRREYRIQPCQFRVRERNENSR
jgi:hypothetical protein